MSEKKYARALGMKTQLLADQPWVQDLLARESFTSKEAGELSGRYGPDTLGQLRNAKGLRLITLGPLEGGHPHAKQFRLERANDTTGPVA